MTSKGEQELTIKDKITDIQSIILADKDVFIGPILSDNRIIDIIITKYQYYVDHTINGVRIKIDHDMKHKGCINVKITMDDLKFVSKTYKINSKGATPDQTIIELEILPHIILKMKSENGHKSRIHTYHSYYPCKLHFRLIIEVDTSKVKTNAMSMNFLKEIGEDLQKFYTEFGISHDKKQQNGRASDGVIENVSASVYYQYKKMVDVNEEIRVRDYDITNKYTFVSWNGSAKYTLFAYQRANIDWMKSLEQTILYRKWPKFSLGLGYHVKKSEIMTHLHCEKKLQFFGGILADEVGTGKTADMARLVYETRLPYFEKDKLMFIEIKHKIPKEFQHKKTEFHETDMCSANIICVRSRATLIIVPIQVHAHWISEIQKFSEKPLKILSIACQREFEKCTYLDLINADCVVSTYHFVKSKAYKNKLSSINSSLSASANNLFKNNLFENELIRGLSAETSNVNFLEKSHPLFHCVLWNRVILDEFHEVFTCDTVEDVYLRTLVIKLLSNFRWLVSGTPFKYSKINEEYLMVCRYLTGSTKINKYDRSELYGEQQILWRPKLSDVDFDNFGMSQFILKELCRRNLKNSIEKEIHLTDLSINETVFILEFSETENLIYKLLNHSIFKDQTRNMFCSCSTLFVLRSRGFDMTTISDVGDETIEFKMIPLDSVERYIQKHYSETLLTHTKNMNKEKETEKRYITRLTTQINSQDANYELKRTIQQIEGVRSRIKTHLLKIREIKGIIHYGNTQLSMIKRHIGSDEVDNTIIEEKDDMMLKQIDEDLKELEDIKQKQKSRQSGQSTYSSPHVFRLGKKRDEDFLADAIKMVNKYNEREDKRKSKVVSQTTTKTAKKEISRTHQCSADDTSCGICFGEIENKFVLTSCFHVFCPECLEDWFTMSAEKTCPICKACLNPNYDCFTIDTTESPDDHSDIDPDEDQEDTYRKWLGTKMLFMIMYIDKCIQNGDKIIVFSKWGSLLQILKKLLNKFGINTLMFSGNRFSRNKAYNRFHGNIDEEDDYSVILLSTDLDNAGANFIGANKIIFVEPIYEPELLSKNIERQAVGRAFRLGQQKNIEVVRFIINNTEEHKIYQQIYEPEVPNSICKLLKTKGSKTVIKLTPENKEQYLSKSIFDHVSETMFEKINEELFDGMKNRDIKDGISTIETKAKRR
jgi:SNF2 family DNA or RNA helicase